MSGSSAGTAANADGPGALAILGDVLVAPHAAFAALRARTHWRWAFVITILLGLVGGFLLLPASLNMTTALVTQQTATDSHAAQTPADRQQMLHLALMVTQYAWLAYPLTVAAALALATIVFLIGNAAVHGDGTFPRLFGLAANVGVINFGIGYLITGILATLRGASAFSSAGDIALILPSFAWLAPSAAPPVVVLMAAFNPLNIWSFVLLATGLKIVARLDRVPAYALAALVTFGSGLIAAPFAK